MNDMTWFLEFMHVIEKMKCYTRHADTSTGRRESVAEHTFRLCMMLWILKEKIGEYDMEKMMTMCLFHDIGEAMTGDIPSFKKTGEDKERENEGVGEILSMLPEKIGNEAGEILDEFFQNRTMESRIVHALDKMEAVIQHNESDISSWIELEYELQLSYGHEEAKVLDVTRELRDMLYRESIAKIQKEAPRRTHKNQADLVGDL